MPTITLSMDDPTSPQACPGREAHWEQMFARLEAWRLRHGHTEVPIACEEIPGLTTWVQRQRREAAGNQLPPERRARLEALGFGWQGPEQAFFDLWEERFTQLLAYRARTGHCRVPYGLAGGGQLRHWVVVQRQCKKRGLLSAARLQRLDAIGFEWQRPTCHDPVQDARWEEMFAQLAHFHAQHGHSDVPRSFPEMPHLGRWVDHQRVNGNKGILRADRRTRLEALGFLWWRRGRTFRGLWEQRFAQILAYRERFGHCRVPHGWPENPPLGSWVNAQRQFKKRGRLSAERIQRLDEIGFEWQVAPGRPHQPARRALSPEPPAHRQPC